MTVSGDQLHLDKDGFPWPQANDDPTLLNDGSRLVACLGFAFDVPWYGYAEGFLRLADEGVASIEESGHGHDFLVYPILYNYRHYIELSLKVVISDARNLFGIAEQLPRTHDLLVLWDVAQPLLEEVNPESADLYGNVRASIERFNQLDPTAEGFRYPVTSKGAPTLPGLRNLDLGQVRDVVRRLEAFFSVAQDELQRRIETEREIAQAYETY